MCVCVCVLRLANSACLMLHAVSEPRRMYTDPQASGVSSQPTADMCPVGCTGTNGNCAGDGTCQCKPGRTGA